jgi:Protein of unknown function DUF111
MLAACLDLHPQGLLESWTSWLKRVFPPAQAIRYEFNAVFDSGECGNEHQGDTKHNLSHRLNSHATQRRQLAVQAQPATPMSWNIEDLVQSLQLSQSLQPKARQILTGSKTASDIATAADDDDSTHYCSAWIMEKILAVIQQLQRVYNDASDNLRFSHDPSFAYAFLDVLGVLYCLDYLDIQSFSCNPLPMVTLSGNSSCQTQCQLLVGLPVAFSQPGYFVGHNDLGLALLRVLLESSPAVPPQASVYALETSPVTPNDDTDGDTDGSSSQSRNFAVPSIFLCSPPPMILTRSAFGYHSCSEPSDLSKVDVNGNGNQRISSEHTDEITTFTPSHPHLVVAVQAGVGSLLESTHRKIMNEKMASSTTTSADISEKAKTRHQLIHHDSTPVQSNMRLSAWFTDTDSDRMESDVYSGLLWNQLTLLEANLDDITAEQLSFCIDQLLYKGALDAWVTPIVMKKGRPAHSLSCLCQSKSEASLLLQTIFEHSTTLGVRISAVDRVALPRSIISVQTQWQDGTTNSGWVDVKTAYYNQRLVSCKAEFDHCRLLALETNQSIKTISQQAEWLARQKIGGIEDKGGSTPYTTETSVAGVSDALNTAQTIQRNGSDLHSADSQDIMKAESASVGRVASEDWSLRVNNLVDEVKRL